MPSNRANWNVVYCSAVEVEVHAGLVSGEGVAGNRRSVLQYLSRQWHNHRAVGRPYHSDQRTHLPFVEGSEAEEAEHVGAHAVQEGHRRLRQRGQRRWGRAGVSHFGTGRDRRRQYSRSLPASPLTVLLSSAASAFSAAPPDLLQQGVYSRKQGRRPAGRRPATRPHLLLLQCCWLPAASPVPKAAKHI